MKQITLDSVYRTVQKLEQDRRQAWRQTSMLTDDDHERFTCMFNRGNKLPVYNYTIPKYLRNKKYLYLLFTCLLIIILSGFERNLN